MHPIWRAGCLQGHWCGTFKSCYEWNICINFNNLFRALLAFNWLYIFPSNNIEYSLLKFCLIRLKWKLFRQRNLLTQYLNYVYLHHLFVSHRISLFPSHICNPTLALSFFLPAIALNCIVIKFPLLRLIHC